MSEASAGCGSTVKVVAWADEPTVAVITAVAAVDTAVVTIGNVAEMEPAGTSKGDVVAARAGLLLVKTTVTPPAGAAQASVTVAVGLAPPITELADMLIEVTACGGRTVSAELWDGPVVEAVMVARVPVLTAVVDTEKIANVAPAGTVTVTGVDATAPLLLDSFTVVSPEGAGAERLTVPVTDVPPTTDPVDKVRAVTGGCTTGAKLATCVIGPVTVATRGLVVPEVVPLKLENV